MHRPLDWAAADCLSAGGGGGCAMQSATHSSTTACARAGAPALSRRPIGAGAGYFAETGRDIEPGGEDSVHASHSDEPWTVAFPSGVVNQLTALARNIEATAR